MIEQDTTDLFAEMDEIADRLRTDPLHATSSFPVVGGWEADEARSVPLPIGTGDLLIAFHELRKRLLPGLTDEQWLEVFERWRERDEARRGFEQAAVHAHRTLLCEERGSYSLSAPSCLRFRKPGRRATAGDRKDHRGRASRCGSDGRGRSQDRGGVITLPDGLRQG
jgi:hypothetical protein